MSFTGKIVIAMILGIATGLFFFFFGDALEPVSGFLVGGVFDAVGRIFITLLRMMVVPLVLVSLVCGVTALGDFRTLGRVGIKTLALYTGTTFLALVIALTVASLISPGEGAELGAAVGVTTTSVPSLR